MDEADWLTSTDPQGMLAFLRNSGKLSERKLRLFAVACCRRVWHLLTDERSRNAVDIAEQYADGEVSEQEMGRAAAQAFAAAETVKSSASRATRWAVIHNPP